MLPQAKKRLRRFQILVRGIPPLGLLVVNPKFSLELTADVQLKGRPL